MTAPPIDTRSRILIVDDVQENLHVLLDVLRSDYAVVAATSGERALALARAAPAPDLVLLDIKMPDMDGYSVLAALKSDPATAGIPVIFVTGLSDAADEALGLSMGVSDYITKPINPDLLRTRVQTQLDLSQLRAGQARIDVTAGDAGVRPAILVVDDVPENVHTLVESLKEDYRIAVALNGERALSVVSGPQSPDLVLLDIAMPGIDGFEVCRRIKADPATRGIPVIFVSGADTTEEKVRGLELGAADFVTKPFDVAEVRARIRTHLELAGLRRFLEDVVAQRTAMLEVSEEKYRQLTHRDPLTGLANRVLHAELLDRAIQKVERDEQPLELVLLDLNQLARINTSLGHKAGDRVIVEVARRLRDSVPDPDSLARTGGDEFAVLIDPTRGQAADLVAQRLIDVVREPIDVGSEIVYIEASVGIAQFPGDGRDAEALQSSAGTALSEAKAVGRGAFRFSSAELTTRARARVALESDLRRALDRNEFALFYQPQVELATGRIIGLEALIRWIHPERGTVSPDEFIPLAEESGLIVQMGQWTLREACRQVSDWHNAGIAPHVTAVNVSAVQLGTTDIASSVQSAMEDADVPARLIELEITESFVMADLEHSLATVDALKALGPRLSIDDFGTGYSSLAYLQRLDVDKLKIDMSFVRAMNSNGGNTAIVQAVIALGHGLGLEVIAEGVEGVEQARTLRDLGCDVMQGYLVSKPLPAADATALLGEAAAGRVWLF